MSAQASENHLGWSYRNFDFTEWGTGELVQWYVGVVGRIFATEKSNAQYYWLCKDQNAIYDELKERGYDFDRFPSND